MAQQAHDENAWLDALAERQRLDVFGDITGAIAHQLNNALSVVNGYEELLLEALDESGAATEDRAALRTRAQTVHTWTGTALAVARRLHGMATHLREAAGPMDVNELCAEAVDLCRYRCERDDILLIADLQPELATVRGRPGELLQILINLIHTAREAIGREQTGAGASEGGTIRLETGHTAHGIEVVIEDDGPGVLPADAERIFAVGVSAKAGAGSTGDDAQRLDKGLGLAIARRIAERLGGSLRASTGDGGRFCLELPIAT